jgi:hypothetical protein
MVHTEVTTPIVMTSAISTLDEIDIREIAVALRRDVRTVRRVARGEHVRGVVGAEIRRAIDARLAARGGPIAP